MTVVGKLPNGFSLVEAAVAGPASYATATPPTVVFNDLAQNVERVLSLPSPDGRTVQVVSVSGRTLTFRVRGETNPIGAAGAAHQEVPDTTDLSAVTYRALAYGR